MRRLDPILVPLAAGTLAVLLAACGGGGTKTLGGGGGGGSTCSATSYTPNYAGDVGMTSLYHWIGFPVNVSFVNSSGWSAVKNNAIANAETVWNAKSGNQIRFNEIASGGKITVEFLDTDVVSGDAVGLTTVSYRGTELLTAQVQVAASDILGRPRSQKELNQITAHEIGHALGIGGHSTDTADLMYPYVLSSTPTAPTNSDWNTMRTAYCDIFTSLAARRQPDAEIQTRVFRCTAEDF